MSICEITDETLAAWMKSALAIAIEGVSRGESPFGAAIFNPAGELVSREHNQVRSRTDPSAHAEVLAIGSAARSVGSSELDDYTLVATAEPCPMCLATAALAGIRRVVFGAEAGAVEQAGYQSLGVKASELGRQFNSELEICGPVLSYDCSALLMNHPRVERSHG